jgi:cytochrome c oxidase assembly protein subunit 15
MRGYFKGQASHYLSIMFLVAFQGFIGWWMVKSGLVDNPHVSHFRLAVHLITALILYSLILWKIFDINEVKSLGFYNRKIHILTIVSVFLLFVQITLGAFVAGLDAGMIYNTFPMMGANFIPSEFYSGDVFYEPASIQFLHRNCAYLISVCFVVLGFIISKFSKLLGASLILLLSVQFLLGVLTLIYVVPLKLALAHQLFAVLLLSITIYVLYRTRR